MRKLIIGFVLIGLISCGARNDLAPVVESNWRPFSSSSNGYIVRKGDTLYSIAFRYDLDYRDLANYNHLRSPYILSVGQVIKLKSHPVKPKYTPQVQVKAPVTFKVYKNPTDHWVLPAKGRVVENFSPNFGRKGINIAGKKGDKIYAASSGTVAYSGQGLANYGNLIILKHDNNYLTAYGNNAKNLVKEGQYVHVGAVIAEIGLVGHSYYGLHFEIRKQGQPVNPMKYLHI
ncbi:MAG: hypothetical protein A3E88_04420 [Legionellales bacterium RIFCSPHIGHO2_12_FULL_35_11]|nr:MAG: hypothetical protein A3E88_04420 [Legionellales bacterium RIFCSPHIGHO2_12_FULL_35_11]